MDKLLVINDFSALAMALPMLKPEDLRPIGGGKSIPGYPISLIGPGTGLGVSRAVLVRKTLDSHRKRGGPCILFTSRSKGVGNPADFASTIRSRFSGTAVVWPRPAQYL